LRAVAFLRPMASAVSPITQKSVVSLAGFTDKNDASAAATKGAHPGQTPSSSNSELGGNSSRPAISLP
jgi:hypothetical protein